MDLLYIASTEPRSGKTVLAAGLGLLAQRHGLRAAYWKVPSLDGDVGNDDPDVAFLGAVLGTTGTLAATASAPTSAREALERDTGADIALVEAASAGRVQEALATGALDDRRVLLLVWHREGMRTRDIQAAAEPFRAVLAGLLLNGVPALRRHHVEANILPALRAAGLPVLGAVTQSRVLQAPTVGELVDFLGAQVIAFPEGLDELVERIMVGALALDGGLYYYGQADRKVVITRWDRPDLQMPALATGCQALILTGGQGPIPYVWSRVQELRVPVAVVQGGTIATASRLNDGFLAQRGRPHLRKAQEMASLLDQVPGLPSLLPGARAGR
ncbi:MAG: AAA family ATPase [Chloroflexi bacterium]|nr:AAA family ATPase [Chloroflexota bacterium]